MAQNRHHALDRLLAYWEETRGGRAVPALADIDPTDIPWALGQIWLCDRLEPGNRFRYRLAGETVNAYWGFSIAGKSLDEIVPPERLATVTEKFRMACELPAVVHDRVSLSLSEEIVRHGERLILPLSQDGARVDVLLGAERANWDRALEFDPYVSCSETTTVTRAVPDQIEPR